VRPLNVAIGAAATVLAIYVAVQSAPFRPVLYVEPDGAPIPDGGTLVPDAGSPDPTSVAASAAATSLGGMPSDAGAIALGDLPVPDLSTLPGSDSDSGPMLLGAGAPRGVRFGVILVSYDGVETLNGEQAAKRSKAEAKALADKLDEDAKADFHGAVQRGDNGSSDDVGRVPRGVLEANTEYALFSLPVGGVSAVVDTPRGFWIAKRLE
jgi:hypothetical protein